MYSLDEGCREALAIDFCHPARGAAAPWFFQIAQVRTNTKSVPLALRDLGERDLP